VARVESSGYFVPEDFPVRLRLEEASNCFIVQANGDA
jgi:hypothetical protein